MTFSNRRLATLTGLALCLAFVLGFLLGAAPVAAQEHICPDGACAVESREGWVKGPEGAAWARYELVDGTPVVEGDIVVEPVERVSRAGIGSDSVQRWPGGVIPYTLGASLTDVQSVSDAIAHVNANTVLQLVPRTSENAYVEFVSGAGCSSAVGKVGGRQEISVSAGCGFGAAVHEILHASGVWHEQSRTDRDQYVEIHYENIQAGMSYNFDTFGTSGVNHGPYDFGSIMHYEKWAFSANGQDTITSRVPGVTLGQRNGLSQGDIDGVAALYAGRPPVPSGGNELSNGVPVGVGASAGSDVRYTIQVPEGAENLTFEISGGSGDADLYVAFGSEPTTDSFQCAPYQPGNDESCAFPLPSAGTWHVLVHAFDTFETLLVARYDGSGAVLPLEASQLKLKQDVDPARSRLVLKVVDYGMLDEELPFGAGEAGDPSTHGGRIRIANPATGETGTIELPAHGWTTPRSGRIKYDDGVCKVAIRPGKLKVRCAGAASGFTLDEPAQGQLGLVLELGSGGYCAGNGGTVSRDFGLGWGASPSKGLFAAQAAPRPAVCDF